MAESSIPVDLLNPGQVFACLGFLEASEVLCGETEGRFEWSDCDNVKFCLRAGDAENPFETVLAFLAKATLTAVAPRDWRPKKIEKAKYEEAGGLIRTNTFSEPSPDTEFALPVRITGLTTGEKRIQVVLGHWADGSTRNNFKLYTGNRSALHITRAMLLGTYARPRRGQNSGDLRTKGLCQLWEENPLVLTQSPFDVAIPMGGSFNFDPRGAWTAIDVGYSLNSQQHQVTASPVVEVLAAWGLENARPYEFSVRKVRYAVWGQFLPPMLARAALAVRVRAVPIRQFRFELGLSGKNKIVKFAEEEELT